LKRHQEQHRTANPAQYPARLTAKAIAGMALLRLPSKKQVAIMVELQLQVAVLAWLVK
jgi:hypothetical protein